MSLESNRQISSTAQLLSATRPAVLEALSAWRRSFACMSSHQMRSWALPVRAAKMSAA